MPELRVPVWVLTVTELNVIDAAKTGLIKEKTMAKITVTDVTFLNLSRSGVFIEYGGDNKIC